MIDYKEEIKKLLEKVDDYYDLKRTYKLLEYLYLEEVLKTVKRYQSILNDTFTVCYNIQS